MGERKFECDCGHITYVGNDDEIVGTIDCEACGEMIDVCSKCNGRKVDVDDYGVTLCNECYKDDSKAKSIIAEMSKEDAYNSGRPMWECD